MAVPATATAAAAAPDTPVYPDDKKFGTVGAVAVDMHGHTAAATSTGGMSNKRCVVLPLCVMCLSASLCLCVVSSAS